MTVSQLIKKLSKYPPDSEVIIENYNLYNKQKNMISPFESYGSSSSTSSGASSISDESTSDNESDTKDYSSKSTNILGLEL